MRFVLKLSKNSIMYLFLSELIYISHSAPKDFAMHEGSSINYVSKRTGWVLKMETFADVQYCIFADIVGGSE